MKNLAQFKARLSEHHKQEKTINIERENETIYFPVHPGFNVYPNGVNKKTEIFTECKIGRVQSNSFTRIIKEGPNTGKESYMDFGKASEWTFQDGNTAIWTEYYTSVDHSHKTTLKFILNR